MTEHRAAAKLSLLGSQFWDMCFRGFLFWFGFSFFVRERVMKFDWRCLFARPRASWSPQPHQAWAGPAGLWAPEAWAAVPARPCLAFAGYPVTWP